MRFNKIQYPYCGVVLKVVVIKTVINKIFFKTRLPHLLSAHNPTAIQDYRALSA